MDWNNKHSIRKHRLHGLTLIEMIMAIAVFTVILGAGTPLLTNMIAGGESSRDFQSLKNALEIARGEAINRKTHITVCARKDTTSNDCVLQRNLSSNAEASEKWHNGWVIHRDRGTPNTISNENDIIGITDALGDQITVKVSGNPGYIRFSPYGESEPVDATISFCVTDATNEYHAREIVMHNGRVRTQSEEDTACL